jgi:hypothetical protein
MNDFFTILLHLSVKNLNMALSIQPISGNDFVPKLTSNSKEILTEDTTTIDTLNHKEEDRKSHLKEQSTKARILMRAWLYENVPDCGTSSRNQRKIRDAALRLKPLGLTIRDVRRVLKIVFNSGADTSQVFCVAREVAECLLYPAEWAVFDAEIITILSHLFTDLLGCVSVQEVLEKQDQLGWLLVDGSMGLPMHGLKREKLLQKYLAKAKKPSDHCETSSSFEQIARESEEKH